MSSQYNIDEISLKIFGTNKIFFECGGAHPFEQSNTELLEKNGWKGIVVEPWVGYNEEYKNSRPNTILENYALVSDDFIDDYIEGNFSNDFGGSVIEGAHGNPWNPSRYPVTTVKKLCTKHNLNDIHLMTIDVEGYEIDVIKGIDFNNFKIHMIIPEHHWGDDFDFIENFGFKKIKVYGNQHIFFNTDSEFFKSAEKILFEI
jgi:FkbM family methyltransferase